MHQASASKNNSIDCNVDDKINLGQKKAFYKTEKYSVLPQNAIHLEDKSVINVYS